MYKYKTNTFIFKNQMVDYIADYYSQLGNALTDDEYVYLVNLYKSKPVAIEKLLVADFKDFTIYRLKNGCWEIKRIA